MTEWSAIEFWEAALVAAVVLGGGWLAFLAAVGATPEVCVMVVYLIAMSGLERP